MTKENGTVIVGREYPIIGMIKTATPLQTIAVGGQADLAQPPDPVTYSEKK